MKERSVGFTGTQKGMSEIQRRKIEANVEILAKASQEGTLQSVHHGDCIGSDAQFHDMCLKHGIPKEKIVIHPPKDSSRRAFCQGGIVLPEKNYLERNKDIVDSSGCIIATPNGPERIRSGTWSTIRYAKKQEKPVMAYLPDGNIHHKR